MFNPRYLPLSSGGRGAGVSIVWCINFVRNTSKKWFTVKGFQTCTLIGKNRKWSWQEHYELFHIRYELDRAQPTSQKLHSLIIQVNFCVSSPLSLLVFSTRNVFPVSIILNLKKNARHVIMVAKLLGAYKQLKSFCLRDRGRLGNRGRPIWLKFGTLSYYGDMQYAKVSAALLLIGLSSRCYPFWGPSMLFL